jgi:glycosyltransferase involved in cell wall biosynthesis
MPFERIPNLVSVVVPCYNVSRFIREGLNSLVRQTYSNMEIIIVNDGSSDGTVLTLRRWYASLKRSSVKKRIKFVSLPRNIGYAGAVTTGLFLAKGEFIAMQDADDLSHPQRLAKQVQFLRDRPDYGLVGTIYASFPHGQFRNQSIPNWLKFGEEIKQTYESGGHCISHGTICFRGELFDRLGGPSRRYEGAEDYEFISKCIKSDVKLENLNEVLYYYRSHPSQRSRKYY